MKLHSMRHCIGKVILHSVGRTLLAFSPGTGSIDKIQMSLSYQPHDLTSAAKMLLTAVTLSLNVCSLSVLSPNQHMHHRPITQVVVHTSIRLVYQSGSAQHPSDVACNAPDQSAASHRPTTLLPPVVSLTASPRIILRRPPTNSRPSRVH